MTGCSDHLPSSGTRVLLVEDEISVVILAESVLQGLAPSTLSAAGLTEALGT
jgi:CheY-like chemotaxis protein